MEDFVPSEKHCRNCRQAIPLKARYCLHCGQKYTDGKVTLRHVLAELLDALFDLDSKVLRSIRGIFIPGKLTDAYFQGQHVSFVKPLRLFIFWTVIALAVITWRGNSLFKQANNSNPTEAAYAMRYTAHLDSVAQKIRQEMRVRGRSEQTLDSLLKRMQPPKSLDTLEFGYLTFQHGRIKPVPLKLPPDLLYIKDPEQAVTELKITGFFEQLMVKQFIRLMREPERFAEYLVGKLSWMLLITLLLVAVVLKFLYLRRKRFFVEHLVFSMHSHTFMMMITALSSLIAGVEGQELALSLSIVATMIYSLVAMKRYYGQGWGKTLTKYFMVLFFYGFIGTFALLITMLVGALLY
jgi:Protein of unknown function (DUF3667)